MSSPKFFLTDAQVLALVGPGDWSIQDISPEVASATRLFLAKPETYGVFASGEMPLASTGNVVGGIDWVREEIRPQPGEPPYNVYHYEITARDGSGLYPVYARGNGLAPHWSEPGDLDVYFPGSDGSGLSRT